MNTTTVTHITQPYDVYIGRRGKGQDGYFGNPHPVGYCPACLTTHDREGAIQAYVKYFEARITDDKTFRQRIEALRGKRLGCFCHPRECHGDVIVRWLEDTHTQADDDADPIPGDSRPRPPMADKQRDPAVIGIVGSRRRDTPGDYEKLTETLENLMIDGDTLVSGGCPTGADHMAEVIAKKEGFTITIHYPDWNRYGKRAGFERNGKIALDADILIAVVAPDRKGGTEDTIRKYLDSGKGQLILV
jgi:hypothetical protein